MSFRASRWKRISQRMRRAWRYFCWQTNNEAAYCMDCGKSEAEGVKLTTDHLDTYQDKKTRYELTLMQILCGKCNSGKKGHPDFRSEEFKKWIQDENNVYDAIKFMVRHEQEYITAVEQGWINMPWVEDREEGK